MALAHEILYGSEDLARVDVDSYISRLAGFLKTSFGPPGNIAIRTRIDKGLSLPLDDCITCGIIVNELVSNAMKYAFAPGADGEIAIGFRREGKDCVLMVSDNGRGLPPRFSLEKTESFGLRLVANIVQQREGEIGISQEHGTGFTITFPVREPAP
jgi:two-component sensor histidine kinase